MRKILKKRLLFSCIFIFAGTVDDSVFCNHFSVMGKLVIFYYPIAAPFWKHRSDIWNVVHIFSIADDVYPTPLFNQGDVISESPNKQENLYKKGSDFVSYWKNVLKIWRKVPKKTLD